MSEIKDSIQKKEYYNLDTGYIDNLSLLDNWHRDHFFYLRRNNKGRTIALWDRGNIKQLNETNVCVDFVADAFRDLRDHYREKVIGGLEPYLSMQTLEANKAYVRPISAYLDHQKDLEFRFLDEYLTPERDRIKTLEDFVFQFDRFISDYSDKYPILYSTYVNSHFCSLYSTGAMIELKFESHNDDNKREEILEDPSLEFFTELAKEYGFTVPKYAPWCLVANFDSQAMQNYAIQYDALNKKQILKEYYYECKDHDIDLLKGFMFNCLSALNEYHPIIEEKRVCKSGKIIISSLNRDLGVQGLDNSFTSRTLLRKYVEILLLERNKKVDKLKLDILFKECYYMLERYNFDIAYSYIEMKILETKPDRIR